MTRTTTTLLDAAARNLAGIAPGSERLLREAEAVVPGGFTRARSFWPTPLFVDRGDGGWVHDVDGRRYIDALLGYGVMLVGHCHPVVQDAIRRQLERGTQFGVAGAEERRLAELLVDNVPGVEQVMFVHSGTEATLAATRVARAVTGRAKVAKFEGAWHGWHDYLVHSARRVAGPPATPAAVADTKALGIPESALETVLALPYNDPAAIDIIRDQGDDLAAVFFEGVLGSAGCIPAEEEFARALRAVCSETGTLLVVDEIITGFRVGPAGASGLLGIEGDLVTLGKAIGGGLPGAALGGRRDLMAVTQPNDSGDRVRLAGTFSANPLSMVAGRAQLEILLEGSADTYRKLQELGERVASGLNELLPELGLRGAATHAGPLWGLHFGVDAPPRSIRDSNIRDSGDNGRMRPAWLVGQVLTGYLLREGVVMEAPSHLGFLSTAHTPEMADEIVAAHRRALVRMREDGVLPEDDSVIGGPR